MVISRCTAAGGPQNADPAVLVPRVMHAATHRDPIGSMKRGMRFFSAAGAGLWFTAIGRR